MIWFGLFLWHMNHCRLFDAESSLYIFIKYTWFGWVGFYVKSTIVGYLISGSLAQWVECSPMVRVTGVQSQVESYMVLDTSLLNTQNYKVKWSNPGKGVAPSPTFRWSSNRKGSFRVTLVYRRQLYLLYYIWFGLVGFYGISTIVGYLMPHPLYTYILNI